MDYLDRARGLYAVSLVAAMLAGCAADETPDAYAAQMQMCESVCVKPACDPSVDFGPELGQQCTQGCTETVNDASEATCSETYQALLECLDVLTCDDFYLWHNQSSNAPCVTEEQALLDRCPHVGVR